MMTLGRHWQIVLQQEDMQLQSLPLMIKIMIILQAEIVQTHTQEVMKISNVILIKNDKNNNEIEHSFFFTKNKSIFR